MLEMARLCNEHNSYFISKDHIPEKMILANLTQMIMCVLLSVYPFGLVANTIWSQSIAIVDQQTRILICMVCLFHFLSIVLMAKVYKNCCSMQNKILICIFFWMTAFLIRLLICVFLQTQPISDFGDCYNYAAGNVFSEQLGKFPYLGMYALTLRAFFCIVPKSVIMAQVLNCAISAFIPALLFMTLDHMTANPLLGILAGGLYINFPSMVIYSSIPSTEHFSQFYLALTLFLWSWAKKNSLPQWGQWGLFVATGLSLGFLYCYKELFIIVAPAILMACICYEIIPLLTAGIRTRKIHWEKIAKIILQNAVIVFVALIVYTTVTAAVQFAILGERYTRYSSFTVIAYEGLAEEGGGGWNAGVKQHIAEVSANAETKAEADHILMNELMDQYSDNISSLINLLKNKFYIDWNGEDSYYYWTFSGEGNIVQGTKCGEILFAIYPKAFWGMICVVLAAGTFLELFRRREKNTRQFYYIVSGMLFLFAFALMIMEAQGRYKSSFTPAICIMFAFSLDNITVACTNCRDFLIEAKQKG